MKKAFGIKILVIALMMSFTPGNAFAAWDIETENRVVINVAKGAGVTAAVSGGVSAGMAAAGVGAGAVGAVIWPLGVALAVVAGSYGVWRLGKRYVHKQNVENTKKKVFVGLSADDFRRASSNSTVDTALTAKATKICGILKFKGALNFEREIRSVNGSNASMIVIKNLVCSNDSKKLEAKELAAEMVTDEFDKSMSPPSSPGSVLPGHSAYPWTVTAL